ncbi:MAG: hypothetical protein LAT77_07500 [Aliidiomarina sp.]|uniref:hypothetical protein n=1 Tax=Aliidiomarina sp. TaxID=1872439 RepID=UPI0025BBFFEE|nr:hypothetical protein [Aliidiomarina sp.]MCH8501739.1 hypothetical protein [Aliidiomarina sp.]
MSDRKVVLVASMLALLTGCSNAAEGVGEVTAEFDDERYRGITLGETRDHQASATWSSFGPVTILNLQAHDPQAESMMKNVFTLEISVMEASNSPQVNSASFSYWPEGMGHKFYSSEETAVTVTLETYRLGENAHAVGTFSGRMCAKASFYSEADTSDCKDVSGTFDTQLLKGS